MNKITGFFLSVLLGLIVVMWIVHSTERLFTFTTNRVGGLRDSSDTGLKTVDFSFFPKTGKTYISQGYGATAFAITHYNEPWHNGIDIVAVYGAPIESATNGLVLATGDQDTFCPGRAYGKFIAVRTADHKNVLLYGHLSDIKVKVSDTVTRGSIIGFVGATGFATGPHLHFSVFTGDSFVMKNLYGCGLTPSGNDVDPVPYLNALGNALK